MNTQTLKQNYGGEGVGLLKNKNHHYDSVDRQRAMADMDKELLEANREGRENYTTSGNLSKSDSINSRNVRKAKSTIN